ncbi:MAG TPA: hypothetical protein VK627_11350 [Edaphobacter sp.]|nr:hypothetical protein [Edaphobacter sp.]
MAALALFATSCAAGAAQATPPGQGQSAAASATQAPMTKEQSKELFRSVDEILQFVSSDTRLPIQHPVKRTLISRDEVNRFLMKKFDEDESAKRLESSEIVLKKFGLLDRDFHLRPFLISLLTEQIAGFYDNKTKTVNLLNWIQPDEQKPVLAHELTHALQDQKIGLTKWSEVSVKGTPHNVQEDNRHLQVDEAETARSAVAEGQAMAVFIDYTLRATGKTIAEAPDLAKRLKDTVADNSGSPVMARAPLLLQQSLLFPYSEGLGFEQAILIKSGKDAAFAGVLANPPSSSFEIMHPEAYMAHTPVPVLHLPDIHPLLDAEYTPYDIGVMGELDVRILTELFGGREMAAALAPAWNGGVYYAAQRKSAVTPAEKESTASLGLLYYSNWKNADSARSFLRIYAAQIPRKYSGVVRRTKDEADESEQVYTTNEGDVLLSNSGTRVFIGEGFSLPLARKLRDSIASVQSNGPLQLAQSPPHEPTLALSRLLSSFGIVKAASQQRYTSAGDLLNVQSGQRPTEGAK